MWLIVTPCRNEADNLQGLHLSLRSQRNMPSHLWVIVDDGSTDDTSLIAEQVASQHPNAIVVRRANSGGLSGGSAYKAWQFGVEQGLRYLTGTTPSVVMKLDADVRLGVDYFDQLKGHERSGAFGGFMQGRRHREQTLHIPGPVKAYSWAGYLCLDELPRTVGFDVVDEVLLRARGFQTQVVPRASFTMARDI